MNSVPSFGWWASRYSRWSALAAFLELSSDQSISILVVGVIFFVLDVVRGVYRSHPRSCAAGIWYSRCGGCCLGRKRVFSYVTEDAEGGQFSSGAYSEAMMWVFVGFVFPALHLPQQSVSAHAFYRIVQVGFMVRRDVPALLRLCGEAGIFAGLDHQVISGDSAAGRLQSRNQESRRLACFSQGQPVGTCVHGLASHRAPAGRILNVLATGRLYDVGTAPTVLSVDAGLLVLYSLTLARAWKENVSRNIFVLLGHGR